MCFSAPLTRADGGTGGRRSPTPERALGRGPAERAGESHPYSLKSPPTSVNFAHAAITSAAVAPFPPSARPSGPRLWRTRRHVTGAPRLRFSALSAVPPTPPAPFGPQGGTAAGAPLRHYRPQGVCLTVSVATDVAGSMHMRRCSPALPSRASAAPVRSGPRSPESPGVACGCARYLNGLGGAN